MRQQLIPDLKNLEQVLRSDILCSHKPIAIIGGHFPMVQLPGKKVAPDTEYTFGVFPHYTFETACSLIEFAKKNRKKAKIVLVVDDHSLMEETEWYMKKDALSRNTRDATRRFFREQKIPAAFARKMKEFGLTKKDLVPAGRKNLFFQESEYRKKFFRKTGIRPGCAGETKLLFEELARKGFQKIIGFIPERCKSPTCSAVEFYHQEKKAVPLKIILAYLASTPGIRTKQELEKTMQNAYSGIPLIRWN